MWETTVTAQPDHTFALWFLDRRDDRKVAHHHLIYVCTCHEILSSSRACVSVRKLPHHLCLKTKALLLYGIYSSGVETIPFTGYC
jgi:hypothetical protein